jgi:hypothetical protein
MTISMIKVPAGTDSGVDVENHQDGLIMEEFAKRYCHAFKRVANMRFRRAHEVPEIQPSDAVPLYETTLQVC